MIHARAALRPYGEICAAMEAICRRHGYGVLGSHNVGDTLRSKGIAYSGQCTVFEICQPVHAAAILASDEQLASALPCRIAVSEHEGCTTVSMVSPQRLFEELSHSPVVQELARTVEQETLAILEESSH